MTTARLKLNESVGIGKLLTGTLVFLMVKVEIIIFALVVSLTTIRTLLPDDYRGDENAFTAISNMLSAREVCEHQCETGVVLVPRERYTPMGDWCYRQKYSMTVDISPVHLEQYEDCCYAHDICFQICGVKKTWCDRLFVDCIVTTCRDNSPRKDDMMTHFRKCDTFGRMLHGGSVAQGCRKFLYFQRKACDCKSPEHAQLVIASLYGNVTEDNPQGVDSTVFFEQIIESFEAYRHQSAALLAQRINELNDDTSFSAASTEETSTGPLLNNAESKASSGSILEQTNDERQQGETPANIPEASEQ